MCEGHLFIYEWISDQFIELTQNVIWLNNCASDYSFVLDGKQPAITVVNMLVPKSIYTWDGEFYRFKDFVNTTPLETFYNYYGSKSEEELLNELLNGQDLSEMGPGFPDYLRFRLGVVYALAARYDDAIREFSQLASSPADSKHNVFPKMAARFLEIYKDQSDIYRACIETNRMYEKVLAPSNYSGDPVFFEKTIGVIIKDPLMSVGPPGPTCSEWNAFKPLLKTIPATVADLPGELRKKGVSLIQVNNIDANLDGKADWLIAIQQDNWYLVWQDGTTYHAKLIDRLDWYFDTDASLTTLSISIEKWAALSNPVMIISAPGTQGILEVQQGFETRWLLGNEFVQKAKITNQENNPIVQYAYSLPVSENNWRPFWSGYRWNPSIQSFDEDLLDYLLFAQKNPAVVIDLLPDVFSLLPAWEKSPYTSKGGLPRFYYLAALTYELSGDEQRAIDLYWQLWRKFPDSDYARMAQFKLEPINP